MNEPYKHILDDIRQRYNQNQPDEHAKSALITISDIPLEPCDISDTDKGSMDRRCHCLHCLSMDKTKEDNGTAISSTSVDINRDHIYDGTCLLLQSDHMNKSNEKTSSHEIDVISDTDKVYSDYGPAVLMRAIERQNSRLEAAIEQMNSRTERIEAVIERLLDHITDREQSCDKNHFEYGIIQFFDQIPHKITVQYFLNDGKKTPPRIKLELREMVRDANKKPYYKAYQTVYGTCYRDFGRTKIDQLLKLSVNERYADEISLLRSLVSSSYRRLSDDSDMIGTFFYDIDTNEIFTGAFMLINKTDKLGRIFIHNGVDFSNVDFEFKPSKSTGKLKGADCIYTINQDIINGIFNDIGPIE